MKGKIHIRQFCTNVQFVGFCQAQPKSWADTLIPTAHHHNHHYTTTANFLKIQEIKILINNNHILKVFWLYDSMASQKEYDLPTLASPMKLHENDVSFAERRCVS